MGQILTHSSDSRHRNALSETEQQTCIKDDPPFLAQCEEFYEGGPDASELFEGCPKNPGHPSFIPVKDFDLQHLPPESRSQAVLEHIRHCCDRTVRVVVKYTSLDRPDTFPNTSASYPFCRIKGSSRKSRTGTGFIKYEWEKPLHSSRTCPCPQCGQNKDPRKDFRQFVVSTATHVVFDDSEAEQTVFELFYDDENRRDKVKYLYGVRLIRAGSHHRRCDEDRVDVMCVTHDVSLRDDDPNSDLPLLSFEKLMAPHPSFEISITSHPAFNKLVTTSYSSFEKMASTQPSSCVKLKQTTPRSSFEELNPFLLPSDNEHKSYGILISHPHGKSKHVTVGELLKRMAPVPRQYSSSSSKSGQLRCHSWFKRNFYRRRSSSKKSKYIEYDFCPEFLFGCRLPRNAPDPPKKLCDCKGQPSSSSDSVGLSTTVQQKTQAAGDKKNFKLKRDVTFSIPKASPFLCQSVTFSDGYYKFPPGTKISCRSSHKSYFLPDLEFSLYPGHTWMFYNIDSCPGCSGAPVMRADTVGGLPEIVHSGALSDGTNRSALYCH